MQGAAGVKGARAKKLETVGLYRCRACGSGALFTALSYSPEFVYGSARGIDNEEGISTTNLAHSPTTQGGDGRRPARAGLITTRADPFFA
jgi:hypothetical protein